jgi:dTDP-4-dehydrorhamnose reductase
MNNTRKRILITGASGMLGATLVNKWQDRFEVFGTGKSNFLNNPAKKYMEFDLLNESYKDLIKWSSPDIVLHCAALTDVDYCEENPTNTFHVNSEPLDKFLKVDSNIKVIFISSDAVFDGNIHLASERTLCSPINVYGQSKKKGEDYLSKLENKHLSVRTTILGKNINYTKQGLLEWMINSLKNGKKITLFNDVIFTPITIWRLAKELESVIENDLSGVIHIAGKEPISKYEFGLKLCKVLDLDSNLIKNGNLSDLKLKAKRSKDQSLNSSLYQIETDHSLPSIDDSLKEISKYFS